MRETLSINKLYKNLIFIVIVVGPIYWFMFTTDGKRRTDTVMLWLFGGESIELNFDALDYRYKLSEWKKVYPDLDWQCKESNSSFGNNLCYSDIASYNGIPSRYLSVFFENEYTSAIKLGYRDQYHKDMGEDLIHQLGQPKNATPLGKKVESSDKILEWKTPGGSVLLKQDLKRSEEPVLLWLADKP